MNPIIMPNIEFPLYLILVITALVINLLYIMKNSKFKNYHNKIVYMFIMIYIVFGLTVSKIYSNIAYGNFDLLRSGFSSYGALVGIIIGSYAFDKICDFKGEVLKYSIISLPLAYSILKIGCFFGGCCSGIPYNGFFNIIYPSGLNISVFPIQLIDSIIAILVFVICHLNRDNKYINYITLLNISIIKFSLDYLRYDHINKVITPNQIFSIVLTIIVLVLFVKKIKDNSK